MLASPSCARVRPRDDGTDPMLASALSKTHLPSSFFARHKWEANSGGSLGRPNREASSGGRLGRPARQASWGGKLGSPTQEASSGGHLGRSAREAKMI